METFGLFVESLRRLYQRGMVDKDKVNALYEAGKITADEKNYILS